MLIDPPPPVRTIRHPGYECVVTGDDPPEPERLKLLEIASRSRDEDAVEEARRVLAAQGVVWIVTRWRGPATRCTSIDEFRALVGLER